MNKMRNVFYFVAIASFDYCHSKCKHQFNPASLHMRGQVFKSHLCPWTFRALVYKLLSLRVLYGQLWNNFDLPKTTNSKYEKHR